MSSDSSRPIVCVIEPNRSSHSATFIRAQAERLPARIRRLHGNGGFYPKFTGDDRSLLSPLNRGARVFVTRVLRADANYFLEAAFKDYLKREHIEAVLANYGPTGVSVMEACHAARVPLIVHFHGFDAYRYEVLQTYGRQYARLFEIATRIVAVSRDMEHQLLGLGAPREKLVYNSYGIDVNLFSGANPLAVGPVYLAVGRFVAKKGPQLTLQAFGQVLKTCPEAYLVMIGNGPLLQECQNTARALGILDRVEFAGPQPHAEVATRMRAVRAFVQHSVRASDGDSEGTPVAVLEAGAAGLPVVATRHAGIVDAVIDGETGLLVDEGDIDGMARCMIQLAQEPDLAARLGRKARERIVAEFSIQDRLGRLWNVIESAIVEARKAAATR